MGQASSLKQRGVNVSPGTAQSSPTRGRIYVRSAGAIFAVLSCILGFAGDTKATPAPPTVTSVSPDTGPAAGGTSVTMTGTNFAGVTTVSFGGAAAASFDVVSPTQIIATSPTGTGTVDVTVTTPSGTSAPSTADQFSYMSAPTVTGVSPNTGPSTGGTSVTIAGTNFTDATAVRFGSTAASTFSVVSATQITATLPAGTGTVDVTVTTSGGVSAPSGADQFTYQSSGPTVTSVSPNSGPATGGTSVTITGANLSGATAVRFGGTAAGAFSVVSSSQITATSPAGIGTVDVTVITAAGTSAPMAVDRFSYVVPGSAVTPAGTTTALSSSQNPANTGQAVRFTATVSGAAPTGTVTFLDGGTQIGSATLTGSTASFTTASLTTGSHSITARYSGDTNNAASTSAVLLQTVNVPSDSTKLRAMQASVTPIVAQLSGQTMVGAIDSAIDAGFSDNPSPVTPNGGGFTVQIPLDQPAVTALPRIGYPPPGSGESPAGAVSFSIGSQHSSGPGSLANGRQGGNGAPPGTRLIDMAVVPLPPGSGMPPIGETRFVPNEVVVQFAAGTTPQQITAFAQRFGLTLEAQQTIGTLGRSVYTFRIPNGQSVRQVIRAVQTARIRAFVQPEYTYGLTQDRNSSNADQGDPSQYDVNKLHLAEAHQITKGTKVVVAVIDSQIDFKQPNLAGAITDRYDAGCGAAAPDPHGTGMAGAIVSHGGLLGVAPDANIIAICAFGGTGQPQSTVTRIIKGLDYAIQHGARIVNMSFAGPRDPALSQMLQITREKGVLVIAAAGNAGPKSPPLYPGADPNVMAVTATDEHDKLFKGANQGDYVTIAAPGVNVLVPAPGADVQFTTGTSVATANVSGVAALLIAHNPSLTPEDVRALLVKTAKHLGPRGLNRQFGAGLVDPLKALEAKVSQAPALRQSVGQDTQQASLNSFLAAPEGNRRRVADGFSALGYAGEGTLWTKGPPTSLSPHRWLAWIDVSGTDFDRTTVGSDLKGVQVDTIAGITHRVTSDFLVGVLGGYEHFDYSSQAFNGVLRGDGWTTGAYLGWRLFQHLQFDAGGAWSDILTNDTSGMASGNFLGHRWLVTGGVTGTYNWQTVAFEPSARVYALWEHENAYTDSLGMLQPDRNFATGRASGGVKVTYPFAWSSATNLAPYIGLYGDYYFSMDDATTVGLTTVPLLQGWSARATAGVAMTFSNSAQLNLGGEYGGIGSDTHIWTWRMRGSVPF